MLSDSLGIITVEISVRKVVLLLLVSTTIGFVVTILILYSIDCTAYDRDGKRIPGPTRLFGPDSFYTLIINARKRKSLSISLADAVLKKWGDGDIAGFKYINRLYIVIAHPDLAQVVLTGHHSKFPKSYFTNTKCRNDFLGNGLTTSEGQSWEDHRCMINPGFYIDSLNNVCEVVNYQGIQFLKNLFWRTTRETTVIDSTRSCVVDISKELEIFSLSVACQAGFSFDIQANIGSESLVDNNWDGGPRTIVQDFENLIEEMEYRYCNNYEDLIPFAKKFRNSKALKSFNRLKDFVDITITAKIEKYTRIMAKLKANDINTTRHTLYCDHSLYINGTTEIDILSSDREDWLDVLIQASAAIENERHRFDTNTLRDHLFCFIFESCETVSSSLSWIIYELTKHPDVQYKCQKEVDSVIISEGIKNDYVDYEDISKFPYLAQVVMESLRLHPVKAILSRTASCECNLGRNRLNKGSVVDICLTSLHRHPDFWYQPEEFIPDRFSADMIKDTIKHPFQYIPFSAGPRNCLGQRVAQMEIVIVMVQLLATYQFERDFLYDSSTKIEETYMSKVKNLYVKVTERNKGDS